MTTIPPEVTTIPPSSITTAPPPTPTIITTTPTPPPPPTITTEVPPPTPPEPLPPRIARLNADGSTDTSFDPGTGLNAMGRCVCVLPSGQYLVGGDFTLVGDQPKAYAALLNEDGTVADDDFGVNGAVHSLLLQADGRVIMGGGFTSIGGTVRNRLARLKSDLSLEMAFNPNAGGAIYASALQADGKLVTGGAFTTMGGAALGHAARLYNHEAGDVLTVESSSRITWLRSGAEPEVQMVTFEIDTGSGYTALGGTVERLPDGWAVNGLSLGGPEEETGSIRARALPAEGHCQSLVERFATFAFVPSLGVSEAGDEFSTEDTLDWGEIEAGGSSTRRSFILKNVGLTDLTFATEGDAVTVDSSEWTVVNQPSSPLAPGLTTTCEVRFTPSSNGAKSAMLSIVSDDATSPYTLNFSGSATPVHGSRDAIWQPTPAGIVYGAAARNLETVITGAFSTVSANNRKYWAQIADDGKLIVQTGTGANKEVNCVALLPDGKMYLGGKFTGVNAVGLVKLARVNADGSVDAKFKGKVTGLVHVMVTLDDGSVIVGGEFTKVGNLKRDNLAKVNYDGTVDATWNPSANGAVRTLALQSDGKLLVGGDFTQIASTARRGLARLNADGSMDASFEVTDAITVSALAIDAEGGVILCESSGGVSAVKRRDSSGDVDDDFTVVTGVKVHTITIQCDGRFLLGSLEGVNSLRRHFPDGTVDTSFSTGTVGSVYSLTGLSSGKVIAGGDFTVDGVKAKLARLTNGVATSALTVVDSTKVQWLRGGTAPETQRVIFQLREGSSAKWVKLGTGQRIPGGWQLEGVSLPIAGEVRALAYIPGGYGNGSSGLFEVIEAFSGQPVADLDVRYLGVSIPPNGSLTFPGMLREQTVDLSVSLINSGKAPLTSIGLTVDSAEWQVISLSSTTLAVGQTGTAVLRFSPTGTGYREGNLTIVSSVPGAKSPYMLKLLGAGVALPTATARDVLSENTTTSGARLRGSVKPNHQVAKVYFEYKRAADSVWIKTPEAEVAGFVSVAYEYNLSGLVPGTIYNSRIAIYNSVNTSAAPALGGQRNFTTLT